MLILLLQPRFLLFRELGVQFLRLLPQILLRVQFGNLDILLVNRLVEAEQSRCVADKDLVVRLLQHHLQLLVSLDLSDPGLLTLKLVLVHVAQLAGLRVGYCGELLDFLLGFEEAMTEIVLLQLIRLHHVRVLLQFALHSHQLGVFLG